MERDLNNLECVVCEGVFDLGEEGEIIEEFGAVCGQCIIDMNDKSRRSDKEEEYHYYRFWEEARGGV